MHAEFFNQKCQNIHFDAHKNSSSVKRNEAQWHCFFFVFLNWLSPFTMICREESFHMWLRMGCKTKMEFKPGPLFQASMWTQFKQYSNLQNLIPLLHHCSSSSTQSHQDHTGPPRTNQDQSYMILAFPNPHTISKTPPTCVRSDPWILEPLGPQRITQDQPGPVLHDPCLS